MATHHPTPASGVIVLARFGRTFEALHVGRVKEDACETELGGSTDMELAARERPVGIGSPRA